MPQPFIDRIKRMFSEVGEREEHQTLAVVLEHHVVGKLVGITTSSLGPGLHTIVD